MRNYFKSVSGQLYFFAARSPESAQDAYEAARREGKQFCIYAVTPFPGPWDRLSVIGHRSRSAILQDYSHAKDEVDRFYFGEELHAHNALYRSVGRTAPMTSVAA